MRRRGSGSVYREGDRWVARLPSALGRRIVGRFDSRRDAEVAIAVELDDMTRTGPTLGDWGEEYLRGRAEAREIAVAWQDVTVWRHLVLGSDLAALPLADVEGLDVRRWLASLRRDDGRPYVSTSLGQYRSLVRKVLDAACDAGLVRENVAIGIRTSSAKARKPGRGKLRMTAEQVDALLDTARRELSPMESTALVLLGTSGMRVSEVKRLTWAEVDLDAAEIRLRRSKSRAGERLVLLMPPAVAALRSLRGPVDRVGPVFLSARGKPHGRGWTVGLRSLVGKPGVPAGYSPGCLRGSVGSILLEGGWVDRGWLARPLSIEEVQTWLGHETAQVTSRHYAKIGAEALRRAVRLPGICPDPTDPPQKQGRAVGADFDFDQQNGGFPQGLRDRASQMVAEATEALRLAAERDPFAVSALVEAVVSARTLAAAILAAERLDDAGEG